MTHYNNQDFHNWYRTPETMEFENGFPVLEPVDKDSLSSDLRVKPFTRFPRNEELDSFIHFYQEDHKFDRVWNSPDRYLEGLAKHAGVFTPDFSLYSDTPAPIQIWNHYRKQWCGAYWQSKGLTVIPTVGWGSLDSFTFCFDGIPRRSVVTVSALGNVNDKRAKVNFIAGYNRMLERLEPSLVLFYSGAHLRHTLPGPIRYIGNSKPSL